MDPSGHRTGGTGTGPPSTPTTPVAASASGPVAPAPTSGAANTGHSVAAGSSSSSALFGKFRLWASGPAKGDATTASGGAAAHGPSVLGTVGDAAQAAADLAAHATQWASALAGSGAPAQRWKAVRDAGEALRTNRVPEGARLLALLDAVATVRARSIVAPG